MTNDEFNFDDDEQIVAQAEFNTIPLIILWIFIGIFILVYLITGLVTKFASLLAVLLPAVLVILFGVVVTIRFLKRQFIVTDKRIIRTVGLLFKKETHIPLNKIQAVSVSQNILEKWLNYGTLTFQNAAIMPIGYKVIGVKECYMLHNALMVAINLNSNRSHSQNASNTKPDSNSETIKESKTPTFQAELPKRCNACGTYNNSARTTCIHCGESLEN